MRTVGVVARVPRDLAEPERAIEGARTVEIGASDGDERNRRLSAFDQLDRGAVRVADQHQADFTAVYERVAEGFAPNEAAEGFDPRDRRVEIGHAQAETLEPRLDQARRRRAGGSGFVPLEQIDCTTVIAPGQTAVVDDRGNLVIDVVRE